MLRAKQISSLSNCARTLLYSGSRCSPADGSSCSCPEDENCLSRSQPRKDLLNRHKSSPLVSRPAAARVASHPSRDGLKAGSSEKYEDVQRSTVVSQPAAVPVALGRSECVKYSVDSDVEEEHALSTSPHMADHLLKAGIAAASLLSDLVNCKLPVSDGSGATQNINYMVNPARTPSNVKSSNVKSVKKAGFYGVHRKSSSVKHVPDSSGSSQSTRKPCSNDNHVPAKGYTHCSSRGVDNPVEDHDVYSSRGYYVRQESKAGTSHHELLPSPSTVHTLKPKPTGRAPPCLNKYGKDMKLQMASVPNARQCVSTGHIVEGVLDILGKIRWGPAAEAALDKLNLSMDAYQGNQVLKQIKDHSVALGFFNWLKKQPRFKHDGHTYTTMVGILGRARQFDAINILLSEMIADGCQPNVVTYNRLIHSYGRANYLNEAVTVFHRMQAVGCQPDRVTYCTLIDIHAKAGYFDVAMYMYQRMQEAGLSPDTFTYSVIINCLGKAGHLAAAHKLFCEMVDQGCVPNLVTYNIMIALQAKARNYPVALDMYRDMQNAGYEPDKVTYSIVMEVLGHCGYLEEAERIFTEMKRRNWVPDEPVYGLLVDLWGKVGNAEKALAWYQAMLNAGLFPNVPTCNSLLSAFLRVHRLVDAYNLLQSMVQMGLRPSLQTYTLLLSNSTEAKSSFDMGFCGQLMAITGHPAHAFLLSMPPAGPDGQNVRDHVGRFLDLMHSEDRESKRGLVDAVVDFLHKSGLKEEAGSVWEVAAEKNVYPDAVKEKSKYYWLINLHVMSDGTAVTALSRTLAWFHRQLLVSGIGPCRIDIVTGWGRRSRVTGSSLVRQAVQELLDLFRFPFFTENGNSGCFVGCGEPLNRWLLQSYVERMHLL